MTVTGSVPFPFITKEGSLSSFKTTTAEQFNQEFNYGDVVTGSYPLSSSISSDYYETGSYIYLTTDRKKNLLALKNTLNYYSKISPHYQFSSSLGDKETQELRLLSIPSIFYGQAIKKGSVSCKWYYTGSLMAELRDVKQNGELIQVYPPGVNSGSVAGTILYKEGFAILTGSWNLHDTYQDYFNPNTYTTLYPPSWKYFMHTGSNSISTNTRDSSFLLDFDGTEKIPSLTMFAKAEKGEFNYSNNPTFIKYGQTKARQTGSFSLKEPEQLSIKNIVSASYEDEEPPFEKITYISKVAIYDKNKNLIGVAKLANPIKKTQNENVAIKLKLDL
jgi:hypothetical protein